MDLTNSSAIVTGGASGLGAATSELLASHGVKVFALDLLAGIESRGLTTPGKTFSHTRSIGSASHS